MPDPRLPKFTDANLLLDLSKIINSNPFANHFIAEQAKEKKKVTMADCFDMAEQFLNSYKYPDSTDENVKTISALLFNFRVMKNSLDSAKQNSNDLNKLLAAATQAKLQYLAFTQADPSFSECVKNFVSDVTKKGVSLSDDGLRMLVSIAQTVDDITDRCDMQLDKEFLQESGELAKEGIGLHDEVTKMIDEYSEDCYNNNILGMALHIDEHEWLDKRFKYSNQVTTNKNIELEHTNEYNELSKRITNNKDKIHELDKQAAAESEKSKFYSELMTRLKGMADEVNSIRKEATDLENDIKTNEYNLDQINNKIIEGEEKLAQYQKSVDFINNMPPEQKESIAKAQQLSAANNVIRSGYNMLRQFNSDFSDSYRYSLANGGDLTGINPETQQRIAFYNEIKGKMIAAAPSLKEKFDAFEKNTANKIPADFNKCMGEDIFKNMNDRSAIYNATFNTKYFARYMEASREVDMLGATQNVLKSLQTEKFNLEFDIKEAKDKLPDAKERASNWANLFKNALGDKFPKNVTPGEIGKVLSNEIRTAKSNLEKIQKEKNSLDKSVEADSKRMDSLKEGLDALKKIALNDEIKKCDDHLALVEDKKKTRGELKEYMEVLAGSAPKIINTANVIVRRPMDRLKERLTDIREHFDDVTSFWSKGRSPECTKMMDGINNLIASLENDKIGMPDITAEVARVKAATKEYIDAKHGQNRIKSFTSEQRHWRLSKSEEALSALSSAESMFKNLMKDPNVEMIAQYLEKSKSLLAKGPEDELQNRIVAGYNRIRNQKEGPQQPETQEVQNKERPVNTNIL